MSPVLGRQACLLDARPTFPTTRYQGSKRKLAAAIIERLSGLNFTTVLDAFGGTGAISHALKAVGKHVTYNDLLSFNHQIGLALIENDERTLSVEQVEFILRRNLGVKYNDFIERTFDGIYFTRDENRWLDMASGNILAIEDRYERAIAWFALFQSALTKRPYNLFHRSNLAMRTREVTRTFGNKVTWDRPFEEHFRRFAASANRAIFDGSGSCRTLCGDAIDVEGEFDLVYIDPPYLNARGVGVDYQQFYHFLEGMIEADRWEERIDRRYKHLPLKKETQPWTSPLRVHAAFERLFDRFRNAILAVSYRSDGIPSPREIEVMLAAVSRRVSVFPIAAYKYVLSTINRSQELLFVAEPR